MAFELFLSKKLNKAEENDWLLHNEKADDGLVNGYLVEKSSECLNELQTEDNSMVTQYDEVSESKSFRSYSEPKQQKPCKCTSEVKTPVSKFHPSDTLDYD